MEGIGEGFSHHTETKERLPITPLTVEANSYRTRGEPVAIDINGITSIWHSVKGGVHEEEQKGGETGQYEIFYNPETNSWLKTSPPDMNHPKMETRLRKSFPMAQAACVVAGIPEIATQMEEHDLVVRDKKVYGFTTPHMGQSLEHYIKVSRKNQRTPDDLAVIRDIYEIAFAQAKQLYQEHGYWTHDPNPGNIVLHAKDDQYYVVLIDFANRQQEKKVTASRIPDHIPGHQKEEIIEKRKQQQLDQLRKNFMSQYKNACNQLVPIEQDDMPPANFA